MAHLPVHHRGPVALAPLVLAAVPFMALHSASSGVRTHPVTVPAHVLFAFGREGGNMRPLSVMIDDTGAVTTSYASAGAHAPLRLSTDALAGLLDPPRAERFSALPTRGAAPTPAPANHSPPPRRGYLLSTSAVQR